MKEVHITNTGYKYIKTCCSAEDYYTCMNYVQYNNGYVFALFSLDQWFPAVGAVAT